MQETYQPNIIEAASQKFWQDNNSFVATENNQDKFYCLSMLPYPSGELHMGHVRNYTIGDVIAKYQIMQGKNVLQPMGWDAFGLPAENAAIKNNIAPYEWTKTNIANMKKQLQLLGYGYDWNRELATCDSKYYKWEQYLFIKMLNKGLIYRKKSEVNWDPVDNTVLANEQVIDGKGWRSGADVEKRQIWGWFIKTTAYATELLSDLDKLKDWPEEVKTMQKNWIGESHGAEIKFEVPGFGEITVFTTRADTLMGNTYLAVAFDHPLAIQSANNNLELADFIKENKIQTTAEADRAKAEKVGKFTGLYAIHPLTGAKLPVWVANFVLLDYGTGAVMSVPAHDQRDHEFATKYKLAIKYVIKPNDNSEPATDMAYTSPGITINSDKYNDLTSAEAAKKITEDLAKNNAGIQKTIYKLRDWGISRQRYWGCPIPIIHCENCGIVAEKESNLPVVLPTNLKVTASGSPLKTCKAFINTKCPECGNDAKRETDTFDTFVDSSWYFLRYTCNDADDTILDDRAKYWAPIDQYVGGIEHAILHLLYARLMHKVLRDLGYVTTDEPIISLLTQGMVLKDSQKMSKSKGNTVAPMPLIEQYGADTLRLFTIFSAPPEQSLEWCDHSVVGSHKFLKKVWAFCYSNKDKIGDITTTTNNQNNDIIKIKKIVHQANTDMEKLQLNTVVSAVMKIYNTLAEIANSNENNYEAITYGVSVLLRILNPICPHICHNIWHELTGANILQAQWPKVDITEIATNTATIVIQINGKKKTLLEISSSDTQEQIENIALQHEKIASIITARAQIRKIIYVKNKLLNIVAK
jgi:leucyl-tRNA synthetase